MENNIFKDFRDYLIQIDSKTQSFIHLANIISDQKAAEGFYMALQNLIPQSTDWKYVPNATGGFLGFWYHWKANEKYNFHIQIQIALNKTPLLTVKISDWTPNTHTLHGLYDELEILAHKYNLKLKKPARYKAGKTSTLAIIEDAFSTDADGKLNMVGFIQTLNGLENLIDEFVLINA